MWALNWVIQCEIGDGAAVVKRRPCGAETGVLCASKTMTDDEQLALEQWLAIRKEAGLQIDPETAEVRWEYGLAHDPYDVYPNPSEEYDGLGRVYFARCFAHLKTHHRFERMRLRGLSGARDEFHLALVQNLKTLAKHIWRPMLHEPAAWVA
jgi:hypothetical protein